MRKATISKTLSICFLVSTLLPIVLVVSILCAKYSFNYKKNILDQVGMAQDLICSWVESYIQPFETVSAAPCFHSYFSSKKNLELDSPQYYKELQEFQTELQSLIDVTTYAYPDISDQLIYSDGKYLFKILRNELWNMFRLESVESQPWFQHAVEGNGKTVLTPAFELPTFPDGSDAYINTSYFFVTRTIKNINQPDQRNMVIFNVSTNQLDKTLQNMNLLYRSFVVITNERNELLYSNKPLTPYEFQLLLNNEEFSYDGIRWNRVKQDSDKYQMSVHVVYSLEEMHQQLRSFVMYALIISSVSVICAVLVNIRLNKSIYHSTASLQNVLSQVENGNLSVVCPEVKIVEFDKIGASINEMITDLDKHIKEASILSMQKKNLQLYALQSQIRPHFFINTLYSLIALNQIGEKERLNTAFYNLARLMRYILSREQLSTIEQELSFLEDYFLLQQLRFGDRITYKIECPSELLNIQIPKLMLQPLVENAIIHGIEPCLHPCICNVTVRKKDGLLDLLVTDDGIGFDPETMKQKSEEAARALFESADAPKKSSVGLFYVQERLRMWSENSEFKIYRTDVTCSEILIPWEDVCREDSDC